MDTHQSEISRALGRLEAGVDGINERLDKLNGSVARHEQRIGALEARVAAQDASEKATERANSTWREWLIPTLKLLAVFVAGAIATHPAGAIKALKVIGGGE